MIQLGELFYCDVELLRKSVKGRKMYFALKLLENPYMFRWDDCVFAFLWLVAGNWVFRAEASHEPSLFLTSATGKLSVRFKI
ncbi:unnamed protein product [Brugia timori]|uniref:Bm9961 n=2 Tax=Brugia TaxID=6278 RepID=A0A1I9G2I9_BRUMA|nr:Bm9961 [Brugia malayi]VDO08819.1 unnamed protein product [Brugia timori]